MKGAVAFDIVPITVDHVAGFHAALDHVAREKRYLAMTEAKPFEKTLEFVKGNLEKGNPQFVALIGGAVVGWCDVVRFEHPAYAHAGLLGMGIVAEHRDKGIGRALMKATLDRARELGFERIELAVFEGNQRARALYQRFGFVDEGMKRKAVKIDGVTRNAHAMALIFEENLAPEP